MGVGFISLITLQFKILKTGEGEINKETNKINYAKINKITK